MYPQDNIFNIYYNIGRRLPFQVKRCDRGYYSQNWETRTSKEGRTFMVEKIEPKGKYGKAYGYALVDNVPNDEYLKCYYPEYKVGEIVEIPCCGCGGWVLVDVPGVHMSEIFPMHQPDEIVPFGKYKGKTIQEIYKIDPAYIFWLIESDPYYTVNIPKIIGKEPNSTEEFIEICKAEYNKAYPTIIATSVITFGKYKGKTFKEVAAEDKNYISWFLRNTEDKIDIESFREIM